MNDKHDSFLVSIEGNVLLTQIPAAPESVFSWEVTHSLCNLPWLLIFQPQLQPVLFYSIYLGSILATDYNQISSLSCHFLCTTMERSTSKTLSEIIQMLLVASWSGKPCWASRLGNRAVCVFSLLHAVVHFHINKWSFNKFYQEKVTGEFTAVFAVN